MISVDSERDETEKSSIVVMYQGTEMSRSDKLQSMAGAVRVGDILEL
jgi:hypothetical protein